MFSDGREEGKKVSQLQYVHHTLFLFNSLSETLYHNTARLNKKPLTLKSQATTDNSIIYHFCKNKPQINHEIDL